MENPKKLELRLKHINYLDIFAEKEINSRYIDTKVVVQSVVVIC